MVVCGLVAVALRVGDGVRVIVALGLDAGEPVVVGDSVTDVDVVRVGVAPGVAVVLGVLEVAVVVQVASACAGVMPASMNHRSSRVFCPNMCMSASEPMTMRAPARWARRVVSTLRAMKLLSLATESAL